MKKFYVYFLEVLLMIICFLLIAINLTCIKFSEYVVIIPLALLIILSICNFKRYKTSEKISTIIMIIIITIITIGGSFCNPYWNSDLLRIKKEKYNYDKVLSYEEAEEDMKEMKHYLVKCHPAFIDGMTKESEEAYNKALKSLSLMDKITSLDLQREIQNVMVTLHDAHTTTSCNAYDNNLYLKDKIKYDNERFKINKINGMTLDELNEKVSKLYSYEVRNWIHPNFYSLTQLKFYGIKTNPVEFEMINDDGKKIIKKYYDKDFISVDDYNLLLLKTFKIDVTQLNKEDPFVSYIIDEDKSLAVLTIKSCEYNDEYIDCLKKMFKEINDKSIKHVAIDLRDNGGGNTKVANELIRYMNVDKFSEGRYEWRFGPFLIPFSGDIKNKKYDNIFNGDVYILTNSQSFSAAKDFAMMIKDNNLGKIIGESPANSCYGYGEITTFRLKNSGIYSQISTKKFYRINESDKNLLVEPDYPCNDEECLKKLYDVIK